MSSLVNFTLLETTAHSSITTKSLPMTDAAGAIALSFPRLELELTALLARLKDIDATFDRAGGAFGSKEGGCSTITAPLSRESSAVCSPPLPAPVTPTATPLSLSRFRPNEKERTPAFTSLDAPPLTALVTPLAVPPFLAVLLPSPPLFASACALRFRAVS